MNNYYDTLVDNGFLSKAKHQLSKAAAVLTSDFSDLDFGTAATNGEWMWHFNRNEKKIDFDCLCEDLEVFDRVMDTWESLDETHDVIVLTAFDIIIYVSPNKKSIQRSIELDFKEQGLIPYYTTKRKVDGKFLWFCLTWTIFPFEPPNEN